MNFQKTQYNSLTHNELTRLFGQPYLEKQSIPIINPNPLPNPSSTITVCSITHEYCFENYSIVRSHKGSVVFLQIQLDKVFSSSNPFLTILLGINQKFITRYPKDATGL